MRGTYDIPDAIIDAHAAGVPFSADGADEGGRGGAVGGQGGDEHHEYHELGAGGMLRGWAHEGMLRAARLLLPEVLSPLLLLHASGYRIVLTGHSLGGSVASIQSGLLPHPSPSPFTPTLHHHPSPSPFTTTLHHHPSTPPFNTTLHHHPSPPP